MDRHIHGIRQLLDTEPCAQMPLQIIQDRPLAVKSPGSGYVLRRYVMEFSKYQVAVQPDLFYDGRGGIPEK